MKLLQTRSISPAGFPTRHHTLQTETEQSPERCELQLQQCRVQLLKTTERTLEGHDATNAYCEDRMRFDLETHRQNLSVLDVNEGEDRQ